MVYYAYYNTSKTLFMETKLHHLLTKWPTGAVRSIGTLVLQGYSQSLLAQYRKSKWLTSVGVGAVARTGDKVEYLGGLFALQQDLKMDVHVGGRTALELQHRAHFLRRRKTNAYLVGSSPKLPRWFTTFDWGTEIGYRASNLFKKKFNLGFAPYLHQGFQVLVSSVPRAMLEYLDIVPAQHSFEEAKLLMEGLVDLHPKEVQILLEACRSIKVKRLFLLLAEECGHKWANKLDLARIYLGIGKRNLQRGGVLHRKFQITVPAEILSDERKV